MEGMPLQQKKNTRRLLLNCDHRQAGFWLTLSIEWAVLFPGSCPVFCHWKYVLYSLIPRPLPDFILQLWSGSGLGTRLCIANDGNLDRAWGMRLVISGSTYELSCARSTAFTTVRKWPLSKPKWMKILMQCYRFVSESYKSMGSRFPRWIGLLALIRTTSRVFKVHTCTFSLRKVVGSKPDQPDCLLQQCIGHGLTHALRCADVP